MDPIAQVLPKHFGQAIGWTILHSLWQVMLIAILTGFALLVLRHKSARVRYRVTGLGLGLVLLSALATFCWYAQAGQPAAVEKNAGAAAGFVYQGLETPQANPVLETGASLSPLDTVQAYFEPHISLIAVFWCLGFAFCLLRLLGNIGYVHYLKTQRNFPAEEYWVELKDQLLQKAGVQKAVALVESTLARTPLVVGHLKPFIMFPIGLINRLDPYEAEAIIAHEIAHIVRRDYLFNILQCLVETIFYYHPGVWWLSSAMRREREIAADELAIALTGNAVNYAKALVVVQELAYFPLSPALAFAGPRKSQLFTRVQRILHTKNTQSLAMEKFLSAGLFLLVVVGLAYTQNNTSTTGNSGTMPDPASMFTAADSTSGIWQGTVENNQLCLTMTRRNQRNHWSTGDCYPVSDFSPLPTGNGSFTMTREAGTITFTGIFEGKEGYGKFSFQENPAFRKMMRDYNIDNLDDAIMIHLCLGNVSRDYLDFLNQKGYKNIDGETLAGLAIQGLNQSTINRYLNMSAKMGQKNPSLEDLMGYKIQNISEDYVQQLSSLGFKNLSMEDIMSAKIQGITPEFVQECKKMGYPGLSFEDVLSFKIQDLSPTYLNDLKAAGYANMSADDAMAFKIHGITPEYISALKTAGFTLDAETILGFKIHDITPEYVAGLKAAGLTDLSTEDILGFKIHGITPEVIHEFRQLGLKDLNNEDLMGLRIHGIDAAFVDSYKKIFDQPLTAEQALSLKIHEVTPDFIRKAREKGFKNMEVDEYVQLKIQFGDKVK